MVALKIEKELRYKRPSEKVKLPRKRKTRRKSMSEEARAEERFRQMLVKEGFMLEVNPPLSHTLRRDRTLIEVEGRPLSEIIIEERR